MARSKMIIMAAMVAVLISASPTFGAVVLLTAGTDAAIGPPETSIPPQFNPHIPPISPGSILTPIPPIPLNGLATGPLNGIGYGPGAFAGVTGGSTGWVNITYTITAADLGLPLFIEVANVGDTAFQSAIAIDNIRINNIVVEGFESGLPGPPFVFSGFAATSGDVTNLEATEGSMFGFLDTTGLSTAVFDTVDGTSAGNMFATLLLLAGDVLSLDVAFLTTDGTTEFHDYGIVSLGVPQVVGVVPEPASCTIFLGLFAAGVFVRLRQKRKSA